MLKAIRHFAALDGFVLDPELKEAITSCKDLIHSTAPERIKYELDLIMVSQGVARGMEILSQTGLIFEIIPELTALRTMDIEKQFSLETYGHTLYGFSFLHSRGGDYVSDPASLKDVGYALLFHDLGKAHTYSYDEKKGLVHFFNHERISRDIAVSHHGPPEVQYTGVQTDMLPYRAPHAHLFDKLGGRNGKSHTAADLQDGRY